MHRFTRSKKLSLVCGTNKNKLEKTTLKVKKKVQDAEDSSSDSDIENYLQPADKIDLNSSFFQTQKSPEIESFESIEKNIFAGADRLSDTDSDDESEHNQQEKMPTTSKLNFEQLHSYTNKLDEMKKVVQNYKAKQKREETQIPSSDNISDLLASGETQVDKLNNNDSLHSSDFQSCSEVEDNDWEEVEDRLVKPSTSISKDGIQITVSLPDTMKKKKGVDLLASMKRRLNRIKKEHQVLIHKVHLLCWIAHGNYINKSLNSETLLGLALSLIPSQHCYPPERTDLTYLEQIVNWYNKVMELTEKIVSKEWSLEKVLKLQLIRKQAYNKKMLTYIFICILRSLGIQCRLVLSFQVLPLRPPSNQLHSLSTKIKEDKTKQNGNVKAKKESTNKESSTTTTGKIEAEQSIVEKLTKSSKKSAPVENGSKNTRKSSESETSKIETEQGNVEKRKNNSKKRIEKLHVENEGKQQNIRKSSGSRTSKVEAEKSPEGNLKTNSRKRSQVHTDGDGKTAKIVKAEKSSNENANTEPVKRQTEVKKRNSSQTKKPKESSKPAQTRSKRLLAQLAQVDGGNDSSDSEKSTRPNLKKLSQETKKQCPKNHLRRLKKVPNYTEKRSDEDLSTDEEKTKRLINLQSLKDKLNPRSKSSKSSDVKKDIISIVKTRIKREKEVSRSKIAKSRKSKPHSDGDSDYAPEPIKQKYDSDDDFREDKVKVKRRIEVKRDQVEAEKTKKGMDVWVEVYLEAEEKWISVDVVKSRVHCVNQLYSRASHPVAYIVAWNNNNSIKDITQRYCTNWNTTTRKLRVDTNWWKATLKPYIGTKTARDKEEDEELMQLQLDKPLPSTISEYKNHPLYVLKRHLLKFQALYPPDVPPLGFIRSEPVYSRDCVHVLHSREIWMKEAKIVKPAQQPYKIVKARPKYDKLSGKVVTDLPLEVFGIWQVEDYIPPTAENGVVPRNAYGNVELFKPCMLPKGTVHLQLPGLNKVAKKMGIDCVPAVVGFDFHSGWNHPTYDGFVVCEEQSEVLIAAWYQEQEEQEIKEQEKLEKRVYGNWRKLIKGLLIRERLKKRYDYGKPSQTDSKGMKRKQKGPKFVMKKRRICSDSDSN